MPKRRNQKKHKKGKYLVGYEVELTDELSGYIRYIGKIKASNGKIKKGIFYGIELSEPKGRTDGFINGKRYFTTKPLHAVFVKFE